MELKPHAYPVLIGLWTWYQPPDRGEACDAEAAAVCTQAEGVDPGAVQMQASGPDTVPRALREGSSCSTLSAAAPWALLVTAQDAAAFRP